MSSETSQPSFPKDATVGDPAPLNETLGAAVTAKQAEERAKANKGSTRSFVRGAAIGVGSAALMGALLYANRSRKGDRGDHKTIKPLPKPEAED
jgi:hypothetical protein